MHLKRPADNSQGFTLIELIVTLAVAAIFAVVAVPSYQSFIANQQVKTGSQALFSSLMLARAEAIKRNTNVAVTRSGSSWGAGWAITYTDGSGNVKTIRAQDSLDGVAVSSASTSVTFSRTGRATAGASFSFCDPDGSSSVRRRQVSLDTIGRASVAYSGDCSS